MAPRTPQENGTPSTIPSKRKAKISNEPSKAPRRSARGTVQSPIDSLSILRYFLSPSSLDQCRPKDETFDLQSRASDIRTYSSSTFTPFEELASAVILSRPISHTLGLRTIRTIFNPPYQFKTPKALREAGGEGRRKALDEARTQHRQKTADELGGLADAVVERIGDGEEDVELEKVRNEAGKDPEKERQFLKKNIKGLGNTGLDIFFRRVQCVWEEAYPFADPRTLDALEWFDLPTTAKGLKELLDEKWEELSSGEDKAAQDDASRHRRVFVQILERAIGAYLEGNVDNVKAEAMKSASATITQQDVVE